MISSAGVLMSDDVDPAATATAIWPA